MATPVDPLRGRPSVLRGALAPVDDSAAIAASEAARLEDTSSFGRGLAAGGYGMTAGSFASDAVDAELAGDQQAASALRARAAENAQLAGERGPQITSYKDVHGVGDALGYAGGAAGQAVASMAPTLAGALLTRGALRGAGALVPSYNLEANEALLSSQLDPATARADAGERLAAARVKGATNAALESIVPMGVAGSFGHASSNALRNLGVNALEEAITEGAQQAVGQVAQRYVANQGNLSDAVQAPLDPNNRTELIDAALQGAIGGGTIGAPAALSQNIAQRVQDTAQAGQDAVKSGVDAAKELGGETVGRMDDTLEKSFGKSSLDLINDLTSGIGAAAAKGQDFFQVLADQDRREQELPKIRENLFNKLKETAPELAKRVDPNNPDSVINAVKERDWKADVDSLVSRTKDFASDRAELFRKGFEAVKSKDGETKMNLMETFPVESTAQVQQALYNSLDQSIRDTPTARAELPRLANRLLALSARTGDLDPSDILAAIDDGTSIRRLVSDPVGLAKVVSGVTRNDNLSRLLDIRSASSDASRADSFLRLSFAKPERAANLDVVGIGKFVDRAAVDPDSLSERGWEVMRSLFGSEARAEQVMNYYRSQIEESTGVELPKSETSFDPYEGDFDARLASINAQDLVEQTAAAPRYFFQNARSNTPFLRTSRVRSGSDEGGSRTTEAARGKLAQKLNELRNQGVDVSRLRPQVIGHGDYIHETGGDVAAELERRTKNAETRRAQALKRGKTLQAQGASEEQLQAERDKIMRANAELRVLRTPDADPRDVLNEAYQVVKVNDQDPSGTRIDDNDVFAMGYRPGRDENAAATKVNFVDPSGRTISLGGDRIARRTASRLENVAGDENYSARTRRAFAEGVANLLGAGYRLADGQNLASVVVDRRRGLTAGEGSAEATPSRPTFDALPKPEPGQKTMTYAGVGSRETPPEALKAMQAAARMLEGMGYKLRTGDASGADAAFRAGAKNKEVFKASDATDQTRQIAKEIHPAPDRLSPYALNLQARNTNQVFGRNLDTPADFVLVWTKDGSETQRGQGGTGQAMEMAQRKGIPVINMATEGWEDRLQAAIEGNYAPARTRSEQRRSAGLSPEVRERQRQIEKDFANNQGELLDTATDSFLALRDQANRVKGPQAASLRERARAAREVAQNAMRRIFPMPEAPEMEVSQLDTQEGQARQSDYIAELRSTIEELRDQVHPDIRAGYEQQLKDTLDRLEEQEVRRFEEDTGLPVGMENVSQSRGVSDDQEAAARQYVPKSSKAKLNTQLGGAQQNTISPQDQAAITADLERQLGPNIKVAFDDFFNIGGSGSYTYDSTTGQRVIKIAMQAIAPNTVGWHEAIHDFMKMAGDDRASEKMKRELLEVAGSQKIIARLRELLKDHPGALEQIETDPEERLAYAYQFWLQGQLRFGSDKNGNVFQRIHAFITELLQKIAGVIPTGDRAEQYLANFYQGNFADHATQPNVIAQIQANSPTYADKMQQFSKVLGDVGTKLFTASTDRLRRTDIKALGQIADAFHVDPGNEDAKSKGLPFLQRRAMANGVWTNKMTEILDKATVQEMRDAIDNLQSMQPPSNKLEQDIRDMLDKLWDYQEKAGVKRLEWNGQEWIERPLQKSKDYFPRIWDRRALAENPSDFIAAVNRAGHDGLSVYTALLNNFDEGKVDLRDPDSFTPWNQSINNRVLDFIDQSNAADFAPFQVKDLPNTLNTYIGQAVHRGEYARQFGNQGEWIEQKLEEAKQQGATSEEIKTARDVIAGMQGTLQYNMNPKIRSLMAGVITAENLILLPLTIFSQVVDAFAIGARSNSWADAGKALSQGFKDVARSFTKNADVFTADERLAADLGIIDESATMEAMGMLHHGQYMNDFMRKLNNKFFRLNRMEQWNRSMRVTAMVTAQRFILANTDNPRYMQELGLKKSDVKELPDGSLAITEADGLTPEQARRMRTAMFKFVDTAVLRPNAAHRPVWGNDPRFMLLFHLKQFSFTFQNTVLKRMKNELRYGNAKPAMVLLGTIPAIMLSDLAKKAATGGIPTDYSFASALGNGILRSGLLGTKSFGTDAFQDMERGNLPGTSFLGPSFEHAKLVAQGVLGEASPGQVLERSVPLGNVVDNVTN